MIKILQLVVLWSSLIYQEVYSTAPENSWLSGRAVSCEGTPIEGASVSLRVLVPFASLEFGKGESGSDGRFSLRVGNYVDEDGFFRHAYLLIHASGFAPSRLERVYLPTTSYDLGDIQMHPPVILRGSVLSSAGQPIAGAAIHAVLGRASAPYQDYADLTPVAISDAKGQFECSSLPPGIVTLGASAAGFADGVLEPRTLIVAINEVKFELAAGRTTRLSVIEPDGTPIGEAVARPLGDIFGRWVVGQTPPLAFWRGEQEADERGEIEFGGIPAGVYPKVLLTAPHHRPELVDLTNAHSIVTLQPSMGLEVTAVRDGGEGPISIYEVRIRDDVESVNWCGNCENKNWLSVWRDSAAVKVLEPNRWEIAWNSEHAAVHGGSPSEIVVFADDGTAGSVSLSEKLAAGQHLRQQVHLAQPASLSGRVIDPAGAPVSIRLGVQLSMSRPDWWTTVSNLDGRFEFSRLGGGPRWLYALDDNWRIDDGLRRWELIPGAGMTDVTVRLLPTAPGGVGIAKVRVTIEGKEPGLPILLALDDIGQDLPDAYPRSFGWTDAKGQVELRAPWPRAYHLVPKHGLMLSPGGWRDFGGEFPAHNQSWPWTIEIPEFGVSEQVIDFPVESQWDKVAPPGG